MDSDNIESVSIESKIAFYLENIALNEMAKDEKADWNLKNVNATVESWQDRCEYYKGRLASANNRLCQLQISALKPAMEYNKLKSLYEKTTEQLNTCRKESLKEKESLHGKILQLKKMQIQNFKEDMLKKRKRRMKKFGRINEIVQLEVERDAMSKSFHRVHRENVHLQNEYDRILIKFQKLQVALSKLIKKENQSVSDSNPPEFNSENRELTQIEEIRIENIVGYEGLKEYCEVEMEKYNDNVVENDIVFANSGVPIQELDVIDLTHDYTTSLNKSTLLTDSWANEDDDTDSIIVDENLTGIKQNLTNSMSSLKSDKTRSESIDNSRKRMSIWRNKEVKSKNEIKIVSNTEDLRLRLKTVMEELNNTKDNLQTAKNELNNTKATLALKELKLTFCEKKAADKTRDCDRLGKELKTIRADLNKNSVMKKAATNLTQMLKAACTKYSRLEKREKMRHKNIQFRNTILKKKRLEFQKRIAEQKLIKEGDSVKRFKKDATKIIPPLELQVVTGGQKGKFSHDGNQEKQVAREPEEGLIEKGDSVKSFKKEEWQVARRRRRRLRTLIDGNN